jgi:hypothetical protein
MYIKKATIETYFLWYNKRAFSIMVRIFRTEKSMVTRRNFHKPKELIGNRLVRPSLVCALLVKVLFRGYNSGVISELVVWGFICNRDNKGGWSPIKGKPARNSLSLQLLYFNLSRREQRPTPSQRLVRFCFSSKFRLRFPMTTCYTWPRNPSHLKASRRWNYPRLIAILTTHRSGG